MKGLRMHYPTIYRAIVWLAVNIPLGFITASMLYIGYLMFWPVEPYVKVISSHIETPVTTPYGPLVVHRIFKVNKTTLVTITRMIKQKDGIAIFILPPMQRVFNVGDTESQPYISLPGLPPGTYEYIATTTYHVNVLREFSMPAIVHEFRVVTK